MTKTTNERTVWEWEGEPGLILLQETKRKRASEVRRMGTGGSLEDEESE